MENHENNHIEATATEVEHVETTKTTAMSKINQIFKMRSVRFASAAVLTVGVVAAIVGTMKNHDEETTEEV
jgi:hypothetical protein